MLPAKIINRLNKVKLMREKLKADESLFRQATKKITFEPTKEIETNSKVIAEFFKVYKEFKEDNNTLNILNGFNLRIKRGDRIGIIGPNGTGKTTILNALSFALFGDALTNIKKNTLQANENIKQAQVDKWSYLKSQVVPFFEEIITAVEGSKFTAEQLKSN